MGQQAIYKIIENSEESYYYSHWGANALSPFMRLAQAKEIQEQMGLSISHIFGHLSDNAEYQNPPLDERDMFCKPIDEMVLSGYMDGYENRSLTEMRITLNLDENHCLLEYNPRCSWFRTMGNFEILIDKGLENIEKLLAYADTHGIESFSELYPVYSKAVGIDAEMERARADERFEDYLNSPQAEESRERLRSMMNNQNEIEELEER